MFGFLKDKLKGALDKFSKKVEEEPDEIIEVEEPVPKPKKEKSDSEEKKPIKEDKPKKGKTEEKKSSKKEDKTMTGKPMTKVSVDPDMKEKVKTETSIGKKNVK